MQYAHGLNLSSGMGRMEQEEPAFHKDPFEKSALPNEALLDASLRLTVALQACFPQPRD